MKPPKPQNPVSADYRFILFVAGNEANSRIAQENLSRFCQDRLRNRCDIQVVDVLQDFAAAAEHNILLTPSLLRLKPRPGMLIIGNLKDTEKLASTLQVESTERS